MNTSEQFPAPPAPLSRLHGNQLFLSGHVAIDEHWIPVAGAFVTEARQVFENLKRTLAQDGFGLEDVQHTRVYLADLSDFSDFNEVWKEFFASNAPARTTVGAKLVAPFRIEVEAIAMK